MQVKILMLMCFALFFCGNWLLPVTDPTENCYALTAKEMFEAGDWFSPRIYGNYWYDKPIFFYWEILIAYSIFGVNEFALRFFPAVFASATVFLTYFATARFANKKSAFGAGVVLGCSVCFWYVGHAAVTDMTLLFFIAAALFLVFGAIEKKKLGLIDVAWVAVGFGALTKGPVAAVIVGGTLFIFFIVEGISFNLLWRGRGIAAAALIVAAWYLPMTWLHGSDFIFQFFGVHNLLRAAVAEHPIFDVWYYYIVVFFIGMLPFAPAVFFIRRITLSRFNRLLLIWVAVVFIIFQFAATKYPTYTFPYCVPLAVLFAQIIPERVIFKVAACFSLFLFIANFAAVPIVARNSAKSAAPVIADYPDACVVSFRRFYSGSLVFYSGRTVYRLETDERLADLRPNNHSWSAVNVMPFISFAELQAHKKIIALVDNAMVADFVNLTARRWSVLAEFPDYKVLLAD